MANLSASDKTPVNNFVDVEVEFDYVAELGDELTIQTGEIIKDVKRMSGGWWEGTLHGKRGLFPDNFVKVISKDVGKTKQLLVGASGAKEGVQLRASQKKQGTVAARKRCRVLYSYQPKHEDELELKVDDIVEFESEVEDGWWKGNLRGQCGVFPSNFVELLRTSVSQSSVTATDVANEETTTISVADKNKKNEKLKAEKSSSSSLVTARISSLIQDAESKTKKKSSENLNIIRRESPVGSETVETQKSKSEAGAPKLPPKPGSSPILVRSVQTQDGVIYTSSPCDPGPGSSRPLPQIPIPNPRRHSSALISATEDFDFYDKSRIDQYVDVKSAESRQGTSCHGPAANVKRGSKMLSQLFGKFGFDGGGCDKMKSTESSRHSWTSAIFRVRRKHKLSCSKANFSKIDEETATQTENAVATPRPAPNFAAKMSRRFRSKSAHDLGAEGIGQLCPLLGIKSIDRGSQTETEYSKFGVSSLWGSRRFKRPKTISTQTLPAEFLDEDGPNCSLSPCAVSVHEIYQTVFSGSNTSCDFYQDPLYSEPLVSANFGQMCQSTPAVLVQSSDNLFGDVGNRSIGGIPKRNRIITNPRLFVQSHNTNTKFTM